MTIETLKAIIDSMPKCPIAEYMREAGCDPKDGWILFLPEKMKVDYAPEYVRFNSVVVSPVLLNEKAMKADMYQLGQSPYKEFKA